MSSSIVEGELIADQLPFGPTDSPIQGVGVRSRSVAKWVRLLSRPANASSQWHVLASDREFTIANALCGERLPSAVEVASDEDRTERDGRCPTCETALAEKQSETRGGVPLRSR
jgi:hypothetical protein